MTAEGLSPARRWMAAAVVLCAVLALALSLVPVKHARRSAAAGAQPTAAPANAPLPVVEPLELDMSDPDAARAHNAAIPFSTDPNPAAQPFRFSGDAAMRDRATDCLAAAMLYEAGDDSKGEKAVGQVVLNRLRHPAFPKTVCGVVFQGEERATGCQFTFTCDGAMARQPGADAWERARKLAGKMLDGEVYKPVGHSTHYHTDWVIPYWSASLDKVTAVDTHLFFRWKGWWGTPPAFVRQVAIASEPVIQKLAILSPAHRPAPDVLLAANTPATLIDDSRAPLIVNADLIGKRVGPGKLVAIEAGGNGFIVTLDKGGDPARYTEAAQRLCAGRVQCRVLAWTDAAATPRSFPIAEASQNSMSFSYIRVKESAFERILYNCTEFPAVPRARCMNRSLVTAGTGRPLADERAESARARLPEGVRPVADLARGQLPPALPKADGARVRLRLEPSSTVGGAASAL